MIHEIPGMTPAVIEFGDEVVAAGFTVVMPHLFGTPGSRHEPATHRGRNAAGVREPRVHQAGHGSHHAGRRLAAQPRAQLHDELGGPGVGALGMCFTGGFALAMMVDTSVVAPVLAQPSVPFAVSPKRARDVNLSPTDLAKVKARAEGGCQVLGLRYKSDLAVGKRFETLTRELGDAFIRVEFSGAKHSTLTEHRQQEGVDRVLAFFEEKLRG